MDLINLIPHELDITPTPFCDATIITYKIELYPSGKKISFNLLDDEDFTIPYLLIQSQIHQQVINYQHILRIMYGSLISMGKGPSHLKYHLMKPLSIITHMVNPT